MPPIQKEAAPKPPRFNIVKLEDRIAPSQSNFPPGQFPAGNPAQAPGLAAVRNVHRHGETRRPRRLARRRSEQRHRLLPNRQVGERGKSASALRTGMTGDARIVCERRSMGRAIAERVLRVVRTEFWW